MDKLRAEQKTSFDDSKAELEKGLAGIKAALKVLNEHYATEGKAREAAEGTGRGSLLGKVSPAQLAVLVVLPFLMFKWLDVADAGGSIVIHVWRSRIARTCPACVRCRTLFLLSLGRNRSPTTRWFAPCNQRQRLCHEVQVRQRAWWPPRFA